MPASLSVLIPVYNEERTIAELMAELAARCSEAQLIYVDDGSRDRSLAILRERARPQDVVLTKKNGGKGSAIRAGLECATGEYTVIQDADLEYDPAQIPRLLQEAEAHPGSAVFGSRFMTKNPNIYKRFLLGNKALTACMNLLFGASITDSYTCYKLLPTAAFRSLKLRSNGFELEAEICAKCLRSGISIIEIPIRYAPRTIEQGKKITWRDAVKGLLMMLKVRFSRA